MSRLSRPRHLFTFQPIELGQTKIGFVLAAAMVVLWLFAAPARAAQQVVIGSSQDEFLRVDWEYDLDHGRGLLFFSRSYEHPHLVLANLHSLNFLTVNASLGSIRGPIDIAERAVFDIGDDLQVHSYGFFGSAVIPALVTFTFPTERIGVSDAQISYAGEVEPWGWYQEGMLDFVSVRAIPEPPTAATAALMSAAAAGRRRRRRSS